MNPARRRLLAALPAMAAAAARAADGAASPAQDGAGSAAAIKAAFLLNFIRYTEWPAEAAGTPLVTCFIGRDPTVLAAAGIDGRSAAGRRVQVRRASAPDELAGCQVVYIAASEERRIGRLLSAVDAGGVLTVSDAAGFVDQGGVIELVESGDRFEFDINLGVAQRAGLRLSSQLLKLARRMPGRPR